MTSAFRFTAMTLSFLFALGCDSGQDQTLQQIVPACQGGTGDEGCACYGNSTCNGALSCFSNLCVDARTAAMLVSAGQVNTNGTGGDAAASTGTSSTTGGVNTTTGSTTGSSSSNPQGGAGSATGTSTSTGTTVTNGGGTTTGTSTGTTTGSGGAATISPEQSPVARFGQLGVSGTQMVDASGNDVQLKGVSSMWLNWDPTGYALDIDGMRYMRDHWGMTVFRAAMGAALPEGAGGTDDTYTGNPELMTQSVRTIVQNAIELGVYVIIDWHDHEAHTRQAAASAFFAEMARDYGDQPNVIYEVYNEPLDLSWSSEVVPYHEAVIAAIRAEDPDNIIILGTPNWSQDVDAAADAPIAGSNLMYTLHFYACSHGAALRSKADYAYSAGLPLFVTEWGATHADGGVDGVVCAAEAAAWHDWMDARGIGWAAWKLDGCTDSTCYFADRDVPTNGNWTASDLNGHAELVIERMQRGAITVSNPGTGGTGSGGAGAGGTGSGATSTGGSSSSSCTPAGTCAAGDGEDCEDGELVARDCSGCALLACGVDCCSAIGAFGATTSPEFVSNPNVVTSFAQSSSAAQLEASFTTGNQIAALTFALTEPVSVDWLAVELDLAYDGERVNVSLEDGDAGCLYEVEQYDVDQYWLALATTCWGGFDEYSPVRQINVRLVSTSGGTGSLVVRDVRF